MYLRLTIRSLPAESRLRRHCVTFDEMGGTIGRAGDCDLILPDPHVSRVHASILFIDGAFHIRNESVNGVYLSGSQELLEPGERAKLNDGDVLEIGESSLGVEIAELAFDSAPIDVDTEATFYECDADLSAPAAAAPSPVSPPPAQDSPEPLPDAACEPGDDRVAMRNGDAFDDTANGKPSDTNNWGQTPVITYGRRQRRDQVRR